QITTADFPVRFSHVVDTAQPFLVATIRSMQHRDATIWVICPTVRKQELFFETVPNWNSNAAFLPEAEFAAVENILPDPEIAAERLALLSQIEKGSAPQLIVAARGERRNGGSLERIVACRLRAHSPGHNPGSIRGPWRNCGHFPMANNAAIANRVLWRRNRIAARIRPRYADFRPHVRARERII